MSTFLKYKLDYLLIILLSFPILFLKLGSFSLRLWDESIYATNSIEMMERGEWLTPYFNGVVDTWNTKPPMINWLQIISMKIFGINAFAIRFPSAVAALLTILIVYWFLKKHFTILIGIIGSLVLLTSVGFVSYHGARTGDTDALLTLFVTAVNLLALDIFLTEKINPKNILLISLFLLFGFLTKSVAAFLFLPPIVIYFFLYRKALIKILFKQRIVWMAFTFLISSIGIFMLLKNNAQPGYLHTFFADDMGRVATNYGKHDEPFFFYLDNLVSLRYSYWILFALSSFLLLFGNEKENKNYLVGKYIGTLSLFYFALISFSITKLAWYDIPLFPLLAVNIALLLNFLLDKFQLNFYKSIIAVCIVFFIPYKHVFGLSQTNHYSDFEMKNEVKERYLHNSFPSKLWSENYKMTVFHNGYKRSLIFYKTGYSKRGFDLKITDKNEFRDGEIVMISDKELIKEFKNKYEFEIVEQFENLTIYQVNTTIQTY